MHTTYIHTYIHTIYLRNTYNNQEAEDLYAVTSAQIIPGGPGALAGGPGGGSGGSTGDDDHDGVHNP